MLNLDIGIKHPSIVYSITPIATTLLVVEISLNTLTIEEEIGSCKEMRPLGKISNLKTKRQGALIELMPHEGKTMMEKGS